MPRCVGGVHGRWGTPWVALCVMTLAVVVLMLGDFESILEANMLT